MSLYALKDKVAVVTGADAHLIDQIQRMMPERYYGVIRGVMQRMAQ